MRRVKTERRDNWKKRIEERGFGYHTTSGVKYWNEDAYYEITSYEQSLLEAATKDLWSMSLAAVQYVMDNNLYDKFAIPEQFIPMINQSWNDDHPAIYGRFDLCMKDNQIKMLEFNADTPTSLFEAGVIQWDWLTDTTRDKDQFNSVHDHLVWYWGELKSYLYDGPLHFACLKNTLEDLTTVEYLRDTAIQAGLDTRLIFIDDIGFDGQEKIFVDMEMTPIKNIFKLYPWEWMMREDFAYGIVESAHKMFWIEPAWKCILSNKAILPILWKLYPNHPLLLPSYFEGEQPYWFTSYAKKPILSREGANITLVKNGVELESVKGQYGAEGFVLQELFELPDFDGKKVVVGSWVIGQESCGIGFREDDSLISGNKSQFVPHTIYTGKRTVDLNEDL